MAVFVLGTHARTMDTIRYNTVKQNTNLNLFGAAHNTDRPLECSAHVIMKTRLGR